ncbi:hypothetical protein BH10PSE19_BH10PSE19_18380 [soil metagenome]
MDSQHLIAIQNWVTQFKAEHKRPPRVLHLGNIANNAYINAKVMRRHGIESDVICLNYYHIMGCPEWEDAEFEGDVGDDFLPDWSAVNLKGFKRPSWFVQGETSLVLQYFLAKNNNKFMQAKLLQKRLIFKRWQLCSVSRKSPYVQTAVALLEYAFNHVTADNLLRKWPLKIVNYVLKRINYIFTRINYNIKYILKSIGRRIRSFTVYSIRKFSSIILHGCRKIKPIHFVLKLIKSAIKTKHLQHQHTYANESVQIPKTLNSEMTQTESISYSVSNISPIPNNSEYQDDLDAPISYVDIASFTSNNAIWKEVCEHYDIVQGYSTEGIYPLLAGHKQYTAYEHGTLREIPFQDDLQGRLCAYTYKNAAAVFVTNIDCLAAAERLNIPQERIVPLPHAFDSKKAFDFIDKYKKTVKLLVDPITFIAPARHHWATGDTSWRKGNDVIIHAAKLLHDKNIQFKITFISWGKEIDKSQELISELNIAEHFEWVSPMRKNQLWLAYLSSVAILDQFVVPAMGGVGFESLGLGRRLVTRLDMEVAKKFFGEAPPVYNVDTPEKLADAMEQIIADPYDKLGVGDSAQQWVKEYHSGEAILIKQLQQYSRILKV